jgi:hypothetical protein
MKSKDELLEEYTKALNEFRHPDTHHTDGFFRGKTAGRLQAIGWALGFSENEIKHDIQHGI